MRSLREIYEQIEENRETNIFFLYADHEPLTFQEAEEEDCWRSVMKKIQTIQKNDTWELTKLPQNHKAKVSNRYTRSNALQIVKSIGQCKACSERLQIKVWHRIWRGLCTSCSIGIGETINFTWSSSQMKDIHLDVKSVFLNGNLKEEVYVQQPEGFLEKGQEEKIYRL